MLLKVPPPSDCTYIIGRGRDFLRFVFNRSAYNLVSISQKELEYRIGQQIDKGTKAEQSRTNQCKRNERSQGCSSNVSRRTSESSRMALPARRREEINKILNFFLEAMYIILREMEWKSDNEMKSVEK